MTVKGELRSTPAEVLSLAVEVWGGHYEDDEEVNGGDMVEWFFGTFLPLAVTVLGKDKPTNE